MRSGRIAAAAVVLALVGTACASDDGGSGAGGSTGGPPTAPTGTSGSSGSSGSGYGRGGYGYGSTGPTGSTGMGGATADLTVTAVNYRFDPANITVSSGDVIEVRDTNPQTPHTFTVKGTLVDLAVDPQGSGTVTIDLDPGTYEVICRFHGASQGMTATLTVE
jgi:cytochrome c oxidase subunit 2